MPALELICFRGTTDFILGPDDEFVLDGPGSDGCCCLTDKCCVPSLQDILCATVVTNNCILSTGGISRFNLNQVFANVDKTVRVWQGFGPHCPTGCEDWYVQIGAECKIDGTVTWYLCHDSCLDDAFKCAVDPPDFTDPDWTSLGNVPSNIDECFPPVHTGVPISGCGDGGAYDCEFTLSLTDGACP